MHWVMRRADKEGIKRLYFLARDGQILQKIGEVINKHYAYNIELRYIYSSRHSWILPSVLDIENIANESVLFKFSKTLTLQKLFLRFKIEDMKAEWLSPKIEAAGLKVDEPLNIMTIGRAKKLFSDAEILSHIQKQAHDDFELVSGYLKQEGLFEDIDYAVVDIGWRGSLASALRRLFIKNNRRTKGVTFFFFDLIGKPEVSPLDRLLSFLATTNNRCRRTLRGEIEILMELFTAADHESTYGFEKKTEVYQPVFIKEDLSPALKWGLDKQHQIFLRFVRSLLENPCFEEIVPEHFYRMSLSDFCHFLTHPTKEIAGKVSRFPYNVQQTRQQEDEYNVVCSPFRFKDFKTLAENRNIIRPDDLWMQGSLALTTNAFVRLTFSLFYKILASPPMRYLEDKIRQVI